MTDQQNAPMLVGVRPSTAARCARQAAYAALGATPVTPEDPDLAGYRERGHQLEDVVATRLKREGRRFRRQVAVPWPHDDPFAIGHADFWLTTERTVVEVHSNTGAKLYQHKALQAAMYAGAIPRARAAYVCAIDPSNLRERWWPIALDDAMRERIGAIAGSLRRALLGGELPDRACRHPDDEPGRYCPFRDTCFAGWTWPAPQDLLLVDDIVESLVDARARKAAATADERAAIDALTPFVQPDVEHRVAGHKLRRTTVAGSDRFALKDYLAAGHPLTDDMAAFTTHTDPTYRWNVREASS